MRCGIDLSKSTQTWRGTYERCLQEWLARSVQAGATCLDIGASDGYFALLMAKLAGPQGTIFAFEPGSEAALIRSNFDLNSGVPLANLEVFENFVSDKPKDGSVSIDTLVRDRSLASVDVVKIDVDGGELDVLNSMVEVFRRFKPHVFVEVHSPDLLTGVEVFTRQLGYTMRREDPPAHEHRPIAFNVFYYSV